MWFSNVVRPRKTNKSGKLSSKNQLNRLQGNNKTEQKIEEYLKENVTWKDTFRQYLLNSTLHGLRYVGEAKITFFER